jgi:hypothetical protein
MSTYNKKLPKPSEIRWMNSSRKTRESTIVMPFKGVIPSGTSYIGWRQSSYSYSYQVQYYVKARMIPSKQLSTGSETTKTGWKYPNPDWKGNVDTFNKCVAQDKKNRYYRYYNFANKSLMTKGSYDKMEVIVRVRSFNKSKKQHGAWVSKTLTVKCKPTVKIHKIVALADGGIQIYLNTGGWTRGDSQVILKDVRHLGASKKQNKKNLSDEVGAIGGEEAKDYPYAEFKGSDFNTDFKEEEEIVLKNCVFRTCDGVDVSLDGTYTIDSVSSIIDDPILDITRNEDTGLITAQISKGDSNDDWDSMSCWLNCTSNGETVRYDAIASSGSDDAVRTYKFMPPLDAELSMRISIKNNLGGSCNVTYDRTTHSGLAPILSRNRVIVNYTDGTDTQPNNGMFNGSKVAVMNYEIDYSTDASRTYDKELPFGRQRPVAFLGEGLTNTININGSIDATVDEELKTVAYSTHKDWLKFQEQQGIVLLRMPNGMTYTALCTKCSIQQEDEYDMARNVSLTFEEVEI